jgi:hypothetical protein
LEGIFPDSVVVPSYAVFARAPYAWPCASGGVQFEAMLVALSAALGETLADLAVANNGCWAASPSVRGLSAAELARSAALQASLKHLAIERMYRITTPLTMRPNCDGWDLSKTPPEDLVALLTRHLQPAWEHDLGFSHSGAAGLAAPS